jgi:osmotically-inducible protein OsmY
MTHEPSMVRALDSGTRLVHPVALTLAAVLLAGTGAAQESAEQGRGMQRPRAGPTTDAPSGNPVYQIADHADLGTRVKLQILWRKPIGGGRVNVMNRGDTVILFGSVRSEAARQLAERIALRTVGVGHVDNQLWVDLQAGRADGVSQPAAKAPADPWISTRVAASLRFDRTVDAGRVHVSTEDGVVTLSGSVPTAVEKRIAAAISGDIEDVKAVTNALDVDASADMADMASTPGQSNQGAAGR